MVWWCDSCGGENEDDAAYSCEHCGFQYYDPQGEAPVIEVDYSKRKSYKKKSVCDSCFHKHYEGEYCHVFIERDITLASQSGDADDNDESEDDFEGSDGEVSEKSSDDGDILKKIMKSSQKEEVVNNPLDTPDFVLSCGYERCNCNVGIPSTDYDFIPLPKPFYVDDIKILTYEFQGSKSDPEDLTGVIREKNIRRLNNEVSYFMPHILSFLDLGQCANVAKCCSSWNQGTNNYGLYRDVRDCVPWQLFRPHSAQVDSIVVIDRKVFSGGDRRVYVSDMDTGEMLHQVTRDTGIIPLLVHMDDTILCCSSNGAIRIFNLMHNVKRIQLKLTMWEHAKRVTHILLGDRSIGNCERHGVENHICHIYTASEDRSIRVWDMNSNLPIKTVKSRMIRRHTVQCLTKSNRHLMAGTTGGTVMVFSTTNVCEREDVHDCLVAVEEPPKSTEGVGVVKKDKVDSVDKSLCLQINLRLPDVKDESGGPPGVTSLTCSGPHGLQSYLFAGDTTGRLTIWNIPDVGLEFSPAKSWKPHKRAIADMKTTYSHLITAGYDGMVMIFNLETLLKVRSINVLEWAIHKELVPPEFVSLPRMVTCMHVEEDYENGGSCIVGTSLGEIIVMSIGVNI